MSPPHRRQWVFIAPLLLLVIGVSSGCAAHDHLKDADRAMQSASYAEAVRHYEAAIELKPGWADDPELTQKLQRARRERAVDRGHDLLAAEQWQRAIAQFDAALAIDPDHVPAKRGLARAKRGGAHHAYDRALDLADKTDLDAAQRSLEEAIALNPNHADAHAALRSIRSPRAHPEALAVRRYEAGQSLAEERRWSRAAARFREAIASDANYLPARAAAAEAQRQLETARQLHKQGIEQADQKQLDRAIDSFDRAQRIWPHHPETARRLEQVVRLRIEADELAQQASEAMAQQAWDAALDAAAAARAIFPDHAQARDVADLTRDRAAAAYTETAQSHLDQGRLDEAQAAFETARDYRATHPPARRGLATIGHRRADAAEREGRPGLALLYLMEAAEHHYTREDAQRLDALRARLAAQAGFALLLNTDHPDRAVAADSASFQSELTRALQRLAPAFIAINAASEHHGPTVVADVHVLSIEVDRELTRTEHRRHDYEIEHHVPNPRLPHLRAVVVERKHDVKGLRHRHHHLRDRYHDARRHARKKKDDDDRHRHSRSVHSLRRRLRDVERDLRHAEHDLHRAERKLRYAPAIVTRIEHASWPYTRYTYRKRGHIVARLALREPEQEPTHAGTFTVEAQHAVSDTMIENPNPAIGLRANALNLPSDDALRDRVTEEAVGEAAERLVRRATETRVAVLHDQAADLLRADREKDALEYDVQALVLLRSLDHRKAEQQLQRLALPESGR